MDLDPSYLQEVEYAMSSCNFCTLQWIQFRAEIEGSAVSLRADTGPLGGTSVFVHPPEIDISQLEDIDVLDSPNREKYFKAWLMEIPPDCVC
jgi:hypothetical protein